MQVRGSPEPLGPGRRVSLEHRQYCLPLAEEGPGATLETPRRWLQTRKPLLGPSLRRPHSSLRFRVRLCSYLSPTHGSCRMTSDPTFSRGLTWWPGLWMGSNPSLFGKEGHGAPHSPSCLGPHHPSLQDHLRVGFATHCPPRSPQGWAQGPRSGVLIPHSVTPLSSLRI